MTLFGIGITDWLADVFVHATVLLTVVIAVLPLIRQPARRMTLAWGTLAGLAILAVLPLFPRRPLLVLPGLTNLFARPDRISLEPDRNVLAGRHTQQPLDVPEYLTHAAKPPASMEGEAAIDDTAGDIAPLDPGEQFRRFADLESGDFTEPDGPELDSLVPAIAVAPPAATAAPERVTRGWSETVCALWIGEACLMSAWIVVGAWRTARLRRNAHDAPGWMLPELRRVVPVSCRPPWLGISLKIDAALACGAVRPAILLPDQSVHPAEPNGVRAALAHEWAHIAHGDLWLLALERLLLPVYFAHPLFWLLRRRVRTDQELLADAAAAGTHPVEYAEALLAWAKSSPRQRRADVLAALSLWNNPCTLARRIEMLVDTRHPICSGVSRVWRGAALTSVLSAAVGLALVAFHPIDSAADGPAADPVREGNAAVVDQSTDRGDRAAPGSDSQSPDKPAAQAAPPPEAAAGSPDTAPATRATKAAADQADEGAGATAARSDQSAAGAPATAYGAIRLDLTLLSVDNTTLPAETMAETLRRLAGDAKNMQIDDNVVVARLTREDGQRLVENWRKPGIAEVLDEPRLVAFLAAPGGSATSAGESTVKPTVEYRQRVTTVRIRPAAVFPPKGGTVAIQLDVAVDQKRPHRETTNVIASDLQLSSVRTVETNAELVLGRATLVIAFKQADAEHRTNLVVITPAAFEPDRAPASKSIGTRAALLDNRAKLLEAKEKYEYARRLAKKGYAGQSDVDSARVALEYAKGALAEAEEQDEDPARVAVLWARIKDLEEEIRVLREAAAKGNAPSPKADAGIDFVDPAKELLRLDVKEAEVNFSSAKAEFDDAQRLAASHAISPGQLQARKADFEKAAIALQRAKVRLKAAERPADATSVIPGKSAPLPGQSPKRDGDATRALLELDVREAELDLAAARSAYDEAAQANAKASGSIPARELSARKLAVQKAEIAVERAKLRLEAVRRTDSGKGDRQSNTNGSTGRNLAHAATDGLALKRASLDAPWTMLPAHGLIGPGDVLAVPAPFRRNLDIGGGKRLLTVMGRSVVHILDNAADETFRFELQRGQVVVDHPGGGGNGADPLRIGVRIAGGLWRLECPAGATVGIQVRSPEPSRFEQIPDKNAYVGAFYVRYGTAVVTDPAGNAHRIAGLGWLPLPLRPPAAADGKPADVEPLLAMPRWMAPPAPTTTSSNYARLFAGAIATQSDVGTAAAAAAYDANPEVSRMATDCLALVEAYSSLIDILRNSQHDEARKAAISGLRLWLAGGGNKDLLKLELAKRFPGDEAETVYRLLWGFDENDARNKTISTQLVEWMGSHELCVRELAFYHVRRLTGKTHDYRPNGTMLQLQSALRKWNLHVNREGGLLPSTDPKSTGQAARSDPAQIAIAVAAEREWIRVGYHVRRGERNAAAFYCDAIVQKHPDSPQAALARELLTRLAVPTAPPPTDERC